MHTRTFGLLTLLAIAATCQPGRAEAVKPIAFNADDFVAKLPWFYHAMPLEKWQDHDIFSYEINALELPPGEYTVALVPRGRPDNLSVGFDGRTFRELPVTQDGVKLPKVAIRNRMLSLYVKAPNVEGKGPLETILIHPGKILPAALKKPYRRNTLVDDREILRKENWSEFHTLLNRKGFGAKQLRAMFNRILGWCKRRQVLDPDNIHYGAIYSEEDKYDFRDAAAAAVCFTYAWRDSGDEDYRRRALLARNYCYKGQHTDDPGNPARFGGFSHMIHGAWGPGMQRLPADGKLGATVGVETSIIVNLLVKTIELGLTPSADDIRRLRLAAAYMAANEFRPGIFSHHEGADHDCQNSNSLGMQAVVRAYHALDKLDQKPPKQWLEAARRGMRHYIEGQEAIGCWPYVFAGIGRGQAFHPRNIPDQGMGVYHFLVSADTPTLRDTPGSKEAMRRAARWWLGVSRIDRSGPIPTIDLDDRLSRGGLKFAKFTWCRFMAAASLMRIAELSGEKEPWQQLAMRYMEHVDTKLRNDTDPDRAPFRRATTEDMKLCSWIQAAEWHGVLLREMEERLTGDSEKSSGTSKSSTKNAYDGWQPGGERTTLDGITFDSTIHCGNGHDFVRVASDHYRFRARIDHARYAWRFYFKIECPEAVGKTITLEVADFDHAGRTAWHEGATVWSIDNKTWTTLGTQNIEIVPWTPTGDADADKRYGDASHIPYGVQYRLKLTRPVIWLAVPTPYTLKRRDQLLDRLAKEHPRLATVTTIGNGYHGKKHGYPIRMARIAAPGDVSGRENIFIIAGEHSSETAGIYACEGWMEEVLAHPEWLKRYAFYFVPIVNVDGVYYGSSYYGMAPSLERGIGQNISSNWPTRTVPELKALWPLLVELRPVFFASLHNGRHRKSMEAFGPPGPGNDLMLAAWRAELGFEFEGIRTHGQSTRAWGVLHREGIARLPYTIETLILCRQKGCDTFQESYLATGRQLARGTMKALARLPSDAKKQADLQR